jgi:type I restriction enzyme S subunit
LHRQNKTLEALAETLFRQWFVEEADEGWKEEKLGDIITVKGGTTPSTKISEYWDGDIHWTTPKDLSDCEDVFMLNTERKITLEGLAQIGSGLLPVGSVLLSSRAPIGYLAITNIPLSINQGYIGIICNKTVSNWFIYLWCKENMELIKNSGNGSVFQEISKSTFKTLPVQIPAENILEKFDTVANPYFTKIKYNQRQIVTLETLRDALLPNLMGGKVEVFCGF